MKKSRILIFLLVVAAIGGAIFLSLTRSPSTPHPVNLKPQNASDSSSNVATQTSGPDGPGRSTKVKQRPPDAAATGRLDEDFNPSDYQHKSGAPLNTSFVPGTLAYIQIPSSNRRVSLSPNPAGEYESMPVLTGETIGVRLRIEDVSPGTPVSVVILDGGSFPDGSGPSKIIKLGRDYQIPFRFTTSESIGHHRIRVLPSGGSARLFDFTASES